jgi:uncharacterized membrane protein YgaE (UPF0421/DUF939 family)
MNWPYWPELAVIFGLTTVGNIVLTAFAEQESKTRRLAKALLGAGLGVAISAAFGRPWFFGFVAMILIAVMVIHAWWLPRQGVNGLTAEPRARYRALRGWK